MCASLIIRGHRFSKHLCTLMLVLAGATAAGEDQTNSLSAGQDLFVKLCAPCHSKDGTAQTPAAKKLGVKDLRQSQLSDLQIMQQMLEGRQENQSTSKMPAFKQKLTEAEMKALICVVKAFRK